MHIVHPPLDTAKALHSRPFSSHLLFHFLLNFACNTGLWALCLCSIRQKHHQTSYPFYLYWGCPPWSDYMQYPLLYVPSSTGSRIREQFVHQQLLLRMFNSALQNKATILNPGNLETQLLQILLEVFRTDCSLLNELWSAYIILQVCHKLNTSSVNGFSFLWHPDLLFIEIHWNSSLVWISYLSIGTALLWFRFPNVPKSRTRWASKWTFTLRTRGLACGLSVIFNNSSNDIILSDVSRNFQNSSIHRSRPNQSEYELWVLYMWKSLTIIMYKPYIWINKRGYRRMHPTSSTMIISM